MFKSARRQRKAFHKAERQSWKQHGGRERTVRNRERTLKAAVQVRTESRAKHLVCDDPMEG